MYCIFIILGEYLFKNHVKEIFTRNKFHVIAPEVHMPMEGKLEKVRH
jgi:hypothetical protein